MSATAARGVEIRPATTADVEPIARLLVEGFARTSVAFWRGMFAYPWLAAADKPDLGVVLVVAGEVEGFFGAIYSDRVVAGKPERFCNVFGIYVREAHRRHAVSLVAALVRRPGFTFVNVTPADVVVPLFTRFGFVPAATRRLLVPLSAKSLLRGPRTSVIDETKVGESLLGGDGFRAYEDHMGRTFTRTVVAAEGSACLLMTKRAYVPGRRLPVVELFHASDREFLRRHFDGVLLRLLSVHKATALVAEEQVLGFTPDGAQVRPATTLFKSSSVPASAIDGLYSELAILP